MPSYPSSMASTQWKVQRAVTSVEGDAGQAAIAWRCLGGGPDERSFASKRTEVYETRFVAAPDGMEKTAAEYVYEGKTVRSAILDRGYMYEMSSRIGIAIDGADAEDNISCSWDPTVNLNLLTYKRGGDDSVELVVVQRKIEPPSGETGFLGPMSWFASNPARAAYSAAYVYVNVSIPSRPRAEEVATGI